MMTERREAGINSIGKKNLTWSRSFLTRHAFEKKVNLAIKQPKREKSTDTIMHVFFSRSLQRGGMSVKSQLKKSTTIYHFGCLIARFTFFSRACLVRKLRLQVRFFLPMELIPASLRSVIIPLFLASRRMPIVILFSRHFTWLQL